MRRKASLLALTLAVVLLGSDTAFTRGYVYSHIGTGFTWKTTAQSSWNGSTQAVSCGDWTTYVQNDATACTANTLIGLTWANAHAVNSVTHTPILSNNTFFQGNWSPWTSANTGGCTGSLFSASMSSSDEDADSGLASAGSLSCYISGSVITLSQTVSISGTPTSQTYSFWYRGSVETAGDVVTCTQGLGSASLSLTINSVAQSAIGVLNLDGNWHQVTGSTTSLATGSNTFTLSATLTAAKGTYHKSGAPAGSCTGISISPQTLQVDNFSLSAVY